ncbi:hypothetical protein PL78_05780 [Yersinia entomophaga]|uniref:YjbD family (DUF3811) n=2 Tax=Yersinia TaxID=629 RepID=A0ABN4PQM5_YERET|nr:MULTISPECIES: DUF3811 domain-containing protein [Yersinia]ANI29351.1 hypothetical protein PL78_05780 [Yersinia entomophaga]MDN0087330.1 DUF3811 domain-containing protein [Yersinia nurmii]OWF88321.1 hypothetical protein B4914_08170 [Yersinia entomophaga]CNE91580.1 YjbD family (DUF3811) [Yersinia nurmii]
MKKLTVKEMTASEQRDVKTQLDRARINMGRALTNSEQNKVKDEAIEKIMQARALVAKANRPEKKTKKTAPSTTTFSWSSSISSRPPR